MTYLQLFFEFFKVGLFSIGGGLATLPFLSDLGTRTGWFTAADLANMVAVSESTPGPLGINMATYVGFHIGGAPGGIIAPVGEVAPSVIVILLVARFLQRFRSSRLVDAAFYGLRPASTARIAAALVEVCSMALVVPAALARVGALRGAEVLTVFHWPAIVLAAAVFLLMNWRALKKVHPIVFIAASAVIGVALKM